MQGDPRRSAAGPRGPGRRGPWNRGQGLSGPEAGTAPVESPLSRTYRATTFGIVTVVTLIAFEALAVSTAMPVVAADLDAVREYGFAFSSFVTAMLLGVVVSGSWCDARGPAWPLRTGLVLFGGGLVVCGLAGSLAELLAGRAAAGLGGGLLTVALYVVIARIYPKSIQPRVFTLLSTGWVLPSIIGPTVAGWLAQSVSWRAVFLLVPPLAVPPTLALLPRLRNLSAVPAEADEDAGPAGLSPRMRALAGAGLAVGVVLVQGGLERVQRTPGVGAAAIVAGLVLVALTLPRLLPPGTLRLARGLPTAVALRGMFAAAFFGAETFIPLMLVSERGYSPTVAGLVLTGGAFGWTAGATLQSRSWMPMPRHVMLATGGLVIALGEALLVLAVRPPVPGWAALPVWVVAAFGMGLGMSSTSVLTLRLSSPWEQGRNSAGLQLSDACGSALGLAVTGAAFATWHRPGGSDAALFTAMWLGCAGFAVLTGLAGLRARPAAPA